MDVSLSDQAIAHMEFHDAQTDARIKLIARVVRKRVERERTLQRRSQQWAKLIMQGRVS